MSRERLPQYLADMQQAIEKIAREYGLDFFDTNFEVLDYKTMNEVASYGGFPTRYPHWRYGMEYEHLSKSYEYGLSKIYEMVINNDPCYAYLLEGNSLVDQKMVMAHVYGHNDFFKNNFFFSKTNRRMIDGMANHATRVRRHIERIGIEKVETFIDYCLCLDNLIDPHSAYSGKRATTVSLPTDQPQNVDVPRMPAKSYMDRYINPPDFMESQRKKQQAERDKERRHPERMQRDVLLFLIENAPLEHWERDVLEIIREEAYYFAPQGMTKIMNEGWACLAADSLAFTSAGLIPMSDLVAGDSDTVCDGKEPRRVYDRNIIRDHETIRLRTRRGLSLCGSTNHRVMLSDGETWRRLDELKVGDRVLVSGGQGLWPTEERAISWTPPQRVSLCHVADDAGTSIWTLLRHRAGKNIRDTGAVAAALVEYDAEANQALPQALAQRVPIRLPTIIDEKLGAFLGYLIGDGHISKKKRSLGLTTGDEPRALVFAELSHSLFGLMSRVKLDRNRFRVLVSSEMLSNFLTDGLGLTSGLSAREKHVPRDILRSPENVVRAFLRAYFDCDGYAGKQGVILSTMSDSLSEEVQLLLMNFGVLTRRRKQKDGAWHVHASGSAARVFAEKIGFGLERKQRALDAYVADRQWFKAESWDDEIVSLESDRQDVYDISVEETHRYAACGLVNHNSYWHSKILTEKALDASEIIDYAENNAGVMATSKGQLNPYKLGVELYRHIEDRWDRGRFGKEWDDCDDFAARRSWDRRLGLGRKKIFEVRKLYNDVTFVDEFFTEEFCRDNKYFSFDWNDRAGNYEIASRELKQVKEKLLSRLTNHGQPVVLVEDGNFENRSELLLRHRHEGVDLRADHAKDTLEALHRVWKRPVSLVTRVDGKGRLMRYDGKEHSEKSIGYIEGADTSFPATAGPGH